jgi:hypothetical protein
MEGMVLRLDGFLKRTVCSSLQQKGTKRQERVRRGPIGSNSFSSPCRLIIPEADVIKDAKASVKFCHEVLRVCVEFTQRVLTVLRPEAKVRSV